MKSDAKHHMLVACLVRDAATFPLLQHFCVDTYFLHGTYFLKTEEKSIHFQKYLDVWTGP